MAAHRPCRFIGEPEASERFTFCWAISTVQYLGIEVDEAIEIAEKIDI
jgi:hypothetical protein